MEVSCRCADEKHDGVIAQYENDVAEVSEELIQEFGTYRCFVCKPEEAMRSFVRNVHRMMQRLDDDPYTDANIALVKAEKY